MTAPTPQPPPGVFQAPSGGSFVQSVQRALMQGGLLPTDPKMPHWIMCMPSDGYLGDDYHMGFHRAAVERWWAGSDLEVYDRFVLHGHDGFAWVLDTYDFQYLVQVGLERDGEPVTGGITMRDRRYNPTGRDEEKLVWAPVAQLMQQVVRHVCRGLLGTIGAEPSRESFPGLAEHRAALSTLLALSPTVPTLLDGLRDAATRAGLETSRTRATPHTIEL